jgi:molecular chaperone GrpE
MNTENTDLPVDTENPEPTPAAPTAPENETEKYKDLYLRTLADFDNFRKRAAREKEDAIRFANAAFLERMIPVMDNFELGLEAARSATDPKAVLDGLNMVRRQMEDFLRNHGVEPVEAHGVAFDPNLHEAVAHQPHPETPEGHVVRQLRKGYKLRDRLIRPASVMVSKGSE